jgi:hypothetical protein
VFIYNMCSSLLFFFLFAVLGFELRAYTISHSTSTCLWWFFQDRVSKTVCLSRLGTVILLIPASWVAEIRDVSHWCLAFLRMLLFPGGRPNA